MEKKTEIERNSIFDLFLFWKWWNKPIVFNISLFVLFGTFIFLYLFKFFESFISFRSDSFSLFLKKIGISHFPYSFWIWFIFGIVFLFLLKHVVFEIFNYVKNYRSNSVHSIEVSELDSNLNKNALFVKLDVDENDSGIWDQVVEWSSLWLGKPKTLSSQKNEFVINKGVFYQIMILISHLGFLIILLGLGMNSFWGVSAKVLLSEGERATRVEIENGIPPKSWVPVPSKKEASFYQMDFYFQLAQMNVQLDGNDSSNTESLVRIGEIEKQKNEEIIFPGSPLKIKDYRIYALGAKSISGLSYTILAHDVENNHTIRFPKIEVGDFYELPGGKFKLIAGDISDTEYGPVVEIAYLPNDKNEEPIRFFVFRDFPHLDGVQRKKGKYEFKLEEVAYRNQMMFRVVKSPGRAFILFGLLFLFIGAIGFFSARKNQYCVKLENNQLTIIGTSTQMSVFEGEFLLSMERFKRRFDQIDSRISEQKLDVRRGSI